MANTTTTTPVTTTSQLKTTRPQRLRWHPARLLYIFVVTLVVGILYSEAQALLADPSSALDPSQLQTTFFWHLALTYPAYFAAACVLALGAAVVGWRVERRYAKVQEEQRHQETAATAQVVAEQVVQRAQAGGQIGSKTIPHDLPPRAPGFVGRQQDLTTLTVALRPAADQQSNSPAVAVVGMGGIGKSSLAAEAVHALATQPDTVPGGVTWVRCDERTSVEGTTWIEDQLLAAWGAPLPSEVTARAQSPEEGLELREQALRKRFSASSTSAPALVLLDNVEPDLPLARLLDILRPLGIAALVTTRIEPTSARIRLLNLEVLDTDVGVRLFAERYADRGGKWDAARDTPATRAIVDALGGLPLAIELAATRAARTRLPLATLADELRAPDALARLSDPRDPSAGVRYSLRKTLHALSPSQRVRFAALGLLEGSDWAQPIVERMFAGIPTAPQDAAPPSDDLEVLVAYSLVGLTRDAESETPRVRLHPLVRDLAREEWGQLPNDEQSAALGALLTGLQDWATQHQLGIEATEFTKTLQTLARDEELLLGALRAAVARHEALRQVIDVAEAWRAYAFHNANWQLSQQLHMLQLESARALGDRPTELNALIGLARSSGYLGQAAEANRYDQEALALARQLGDKVQLIRLLGARGQSLAAQGVKTEAAVMYDEASATARELGGQLTNFNALNSLGFLATSVGHADEAEQWLRRAIESAFADANPDGMLAVHNLGFLYDEQGDVAAAKATFEVIAAIQSVAIPDAPRGGPIALNMLGQIALRAGDLETATQDFTDSLPLLEQHGMGDNVLQARGNLALVRGLEAQRRGDRDAAQQAFDAALALFEQTGGNANANDMRPYTRHLLAALRDPSATDTEEPAQVPPEVSAERVRYVRNILALVQRAAS